MFKFDLYYIYVRINLYGAQLSIDFIFNSIVLLFYASADYGFRFIINLLRSRTAC